MVAKCEYCESHPAEFYMQFIAKVNPSFYTLGEFIRGFEKYALCTACYDRLSADWNSARSAWILRQVYRINRQIERATGYELERLYSMRARSYGQFDSSVESPF
jgi:hypothetical protein